MAKSLKQLEKELENSIDPSRKVTTKQSVASRKTRRRIVASTLIFSAIVILYIIYAVTMAPEALADSRLLETIAVGLIGLSGAVVLGYISGQVFQDNNTSKLLALLQSKSSVPHNTARKVSKKAAKEEDEAPADMFDLEE